MVFLSRTGTMRGRGGKQQYPSTTKGPEEAAQGDEKIHAIYIYAVLIIRYPASIMSWPRKDTKAAAVKTQKLFTMYGGFHPNTWRLYRKEISRNLLSVKASVLDETQSIQE